MEIIFPLIIMAINQYDNTTHLNHTPNYDFTKPTCTGCCGGGDDCIPGDDSIPDTSCDNPSCDTGSADCGGGDSGGGCD